MVTLTMETGGDCLMMEINNNIKYQLHVRQSHKKLETKVLYVSCLAERVETMYGADDG